MNAQPENISDVPVYVHCGNIMPAATACGKGSAGQVHQGVHPFWEMPLSLQ